MNPGGAFLAAATGTPLVIYAFNRKSSGDTPAGTCAIPACGK